MLHIDFTNEVSAPVREIAGELIVQGVIQRSRVVLFTIINRLFVNFDRNVFEGASHWAGEQIVALRVGEIIAKQSASLNLNWNRAPNHVCHYLSVFLY